MNEFDLDDEENPNPYVDPVDALASEDFRLVRGGEISRRGFQPPAWEIAPILLRDGGPTLITAAPERFKSWVGMEMCIALATGRKLFGEFEPAATRPHCIYLDLDAGAAEAENKFAMFGELPDNLLVTSWEPTEWSGGAFEALLDRYRGSFVVIDCLSSVYCPEPGADINRAMRMFLVELRALYRKYGAGGALIDHDARMKRDASESYSGPAQKKASIRAGITLDFPPEPQPAIGGIAPPEGTVIRVSPLKMSAAAAFAPFDVRFSFPNGTSYRSTYLGTANANAVRAADVETIVAAIAAAETDFLSGRALKAKTGLSEARVAAATETAIAQGLIKHNGGNTSRAGYVLASNLSCVEDDKQDNMAETLDI